MVMFVAQVTSELSSHIIDVDVRVYGKKVIFVLQSEMYCKHSF